jgi:hypothetical protein
MAVIAAVALARAVSRRLRWLVTRPEVRVASRRLLISVGISAGELSPPTDRPCRAYSRDAASPRRAAPSPEPKIKYTSIGHGAVEPPCPPSSLSWPSSSHPPASTPPLSGQ